MRDLPAKLRSMAQWAVGSQKAVVLRAADELESLERQVEELQATYDEAYDEGINAGMSLCAIIHRFDHQAEEDQ